MLFPYGRPLNPAVYSGVVTLKSLLHGVVPLALRNEIRLALGRYPRVLRDRYPALSRVKLSRKAVVFDIGAHTGYFAECVLAYRPHARIYAFEPLPDAFRTLTERLEPYPNVTVENLAAGAQNGHADLIPRGFTEASSFLPNGEVLERGVYGLDFSSSVTISVPVTTLANYISRHDVPKIDLLKLDVQGFELEVLRGAEEILPRIDWIYTEAQFQELYRGGPLFTDLFEHLHQHHFELIEMSSFRADDQGRLMEADMLFRRSKGRSGETSKRGQDE